MNAAAPTPPAPVHFASLTGVRGLLAWLVVLVHGAPLAAALTPGMAPVWGLAQHNLYWALDLFFVLSGFVITTGYASRFASWPGAATYGRFLWARLSRFYPVHIVVLVALVGAVLISRVFGRELAHGGDLGFDLARQFLMLQGWGWSTTLTWNGPAWSLSAEWFCYLVMPLVVMAVVRLRTPAAVLVCYVLAFSAPLTVYSIIGFGDPQITFIAPLWRAAGEFVAGALLCRLGQTGSPVPVWLGRHTGWLVAMCGATVVVLVLTDVSLLWAVPLLALVVPALAQQQGRLDALLSGRRAIGAGRISVALFLTHVPVLIAAAYVFTPHRFPGAWGWVGLALVAVVVVVVAQIVHATVEVPAQRLMSRLVPSRRVPVGASR